jgi:mannose-6-phosphate isomerase-like protein (cupin superfamily)
MTNKNIATHFSFAEALSLDSAPEGNLAIPVFKHGSMEAELYKPEEIDPQTPHTKDEIYFVARGSGQFFNGEELIEVGEGSFIFVPAGVVHRFEHFSKDLAVWVIFYGPEGGEKALIEK